MQPHISGRPACAMWDPCVVGDSNPQIQVPRWWYLFGGGQRIKLRVVYLPESIERARIEGVADPVLRLFPVIVAHGGRCFRSPCPNSRAEQSSASAARGSVPHPSQHTHLFTATIAPGAAGTPPANSPCSRRERRRSKSRVWRLGTRCRPARSPSSFPCHLPGSSGSQPNRRCCR